MRVMKRSILQYPQTGQEKYSWPASFSCALVHAGKPKRSSGFAIGRGIFSLLLLSALLLVSAIGAASVRADGFPIVGVLHAGDKPEAMAVDQSTHKLYIAYESPGSVVCFEPVSGLVCWRANLGNGVTDLQVDSETHEVFATYNVYHSDKSYVSIRDGANGQELASQETGTAGENSVAFDKKRAHVYVSSVDTGMVYTLSFVQGWQKMAGGVEISKEKIGSQPSALAVNSRLGRLYVADRRENVLRVFDEETRRLISTIAIGAVPLPPIRVDEQSGKLYLLCSTAQEMEVIDGERNKVLSEVAVGPYPEGLAVQTATGRIYIADEGDNEASRQQSETGTQISVLDGESYEILGTMTVGAAPDGVEADPGLHRVYIAVENANAVIELSDSPDLPLQSGSTFQQRSKALEIATWLGLAGWFTLGTMLLTILLTTLGERLLRRRELESPQTRPESASSHSEQHTLPQ
jgi:DNA-binding beta-propeller fold protein YncE